MIIGILILIFIGRAFYRLAFDYERKNAWMYPIFGIASYYGGTFIGGFMIALVLTLMGETYDELVVALSAIPVGIGFCWGLYAILKHNWKKEEKMGSQEILDDNL